MGMLQRPGATGQAMHGTPYAFELAERRRSRSGLAGHRYAFEDGAIRTHQINAGAACGAIRLIINS
jgi:hypothetical protein